MSQQSCKNEEKHPKDLQHLARENEMEHCLKRHSIPPKAKGPHAKLSQWVGGSGEQGIREEITTTFRTLSPTSLFSTTHFMDGETETRKGKCLKIIGLKARIPRQGPLPAMPHFCLPTRGISWFPDAK